MKQNRHSLMAKGLMVLLSLLIMVFIFTYSWYRDPTEPVTASGLVISTRDASTDFEYAVGFANSRTGGTYRHTQFTNTVDADLNLEELYPWDDENDVAESTAVNLLYDYNPTDLTGDGVTLVRPAMNYGNWSINTASQNYSVAEENVQYISFDLIFRTTVPNTTIRLDADSFAKGACETYSGDGKLLTDTASRNKDNKYGAFSTDAIVGAVRVAFLEYEANTGQTITGVNDIHQDLVKDGLAHFSETPALLWIPRPDLYLNNNPNNSNTTHEKDTTGWALNTNVASGTTFNLSSDAQNNANYSTYVHQYYNVFNYVQQSTTKRIVTYDDAVASTLNTSAPSGTNKVTFGTTCDLITLDHIDDVEDENGDPGADGIPDDGYYYGKVRVRIWIEGTDSEARRALAGGKFNISFHISG